MFLSSTEHYVKTHREIENFCAVHKKRFWIDYYQLTQKKIAFICKKSKKEALCEEYILDRIIRHIKAFDFEQESEVFGAVRQLLLNKKLNKSYNKNTQEVINHYHNKILKRYENDSFEGHKRREDVLMEILEEEKFKNYINRVVESRFIDFVRSKSYTSEYEEQSETITDERENIDYNEEIEALLSTLDEEDRVIYKLKYGIKLDNQEFLTLSYKFKTSLLEGLIEMFNSSEKLYIKLLIEYGLERDSNHFDILEDIDKIDASISQKIKNYREKLFANSYSRDEDEVVIKLIYREPLSAKELGELFKLTDKQIYKKIEKITKKLKAEKSPCKKI